MTERRKTCACGVEFLWAELWAKPEESTTVVGEYPPVTGLLDPLQKTKTRIPLDPRPAVYMRIPAGPDGETRVERVRGALVSHFSTCPLATRFSKKGGSA